METKNFIGKESIVIANLGNFNFIGKKCQIGSHENKTNVPTSIGNFCTIGNNVKIGDNVHIGNNVSISDWVKIENNCRIGNNVTIEYGAEIQESNNIQYNCIIEAGVFLGKGNYIGASSVIKSAIKRNYGDRTIVGEDVYTGENVIIGRNVSIARKNVLPPLDEQMFSTFLGSGVVLCDNVQIDDVVEIGANCVVNASVKIGAGAKIESGCVVGQNVVPFARVKNNVVYGVSKQALAENLDFGSEDLNVFGTVEDMVICASRAGTANRAIEKIAWLQGHGSYNDRAWKVVNDFLNGPQNGIDLMPFKKI